VKILWFAICLLPVVAIAQQSPAPPPLAGNGLVADATAEPREVILATEIADRIAQADAAAKAGKPFSIGPLLLEKPFRADMEYRTVPEDGVNLHENEGHLFVVLAGAGTMTLGGTLVNPIRNGTNLRAASAEGGVPHKLVKGDMILVPANTAHSVTQVNGKLVVMSVHLAQPATASTSASVPVPSSR
jgi:quercetin dioxygenase-like cupin family protein